MKIAILGWGSLIWDPRELPREGVWQELGPVVPLEFSRISSDCRLTLVIDREHGEPCETYFVLSPRVDIDDAIEDVRHREGTRTSLIGFVDLSHDTRHGRDAQSIVDIEVWAKANEFDGVVWTDLDQNFMAETGAAFTVPRAIAHLESLPVTARKRAMKYIANAPATVSTPLRRAMEKTT